MNESGRSNDEALRALYDIDSDFSQANDLAAANPQKLRRLQDLWWSEAARYDTGPRREVIIGLEAK
jgi:arylsulfatase